MIPCVALLWGYLRILNNVDFAIFFADNSYFFHGIFAGNAFQDHVCLLSVMKTGEFSIEGVGKGIVDTSAISLSTVFAPIP